MDTAQNYDNESRLEKLNLKNGILLPNLIIMIIRIKTI